MAQEEVYTAWDGSEYQGQPPEGWFLAADNRWWPAQEMIIDSGDTPVGSSEPGLPSTSAPPAPQPLSPDSAESPETAAGQTTGRRSQGRSTGRRSGWTGRLVSVVALVAVGLVAGRCVVAD